MTNFEYYIAGGKADEGWKKFYSNNQIYKGTTTIDRYNNWLLKEHKEPILDDVEKEYLSNVIKPFRNRVTSISKDRDTKLGSVSDVLYYISIRIDNGRDFCFLPYFKSSKMYKNMEINRDYTLKELGL